MSTFLTLNVNKTSDFYGDLSTKNSQILIKDAGDTSKITLSASQFTADVPAHFEQNFTVGKPGTDPVLFVMPDLAEGAPILSVQHPTTGYRLVVNQDTVYIPTLSAGISMSTGTAALVVNDTGVTLTNTKLHNGSGYTYAEGVKFVSDATSPTTDEGLHLTHGFIEQHRQTKANGSVLRSINGHTGLERLEILTNGDDSSAVAEFTDSGIQFTQDVNMGTKRLICKDLEVKGTMTTVNSQDVNIGDSHIHLNAFNSASDYQDSGIVSTCRIVQGSTGNDAKYSGRTFNVGDEFINIGMNGAAITNPGRCIVRIINSADEADPINGLYETNTAMSGNNKWYPSASPTLTFVKSGFPVGHVTVTATIDVQIVEVSHLYFYEGLADDSDGAHGTVKFGHGWTAEDLIASYTDLTAGDVEHSYKSTDLEGLTSSSENVTVRSAIESFGGNPASSFEGVHLPANAPAGSTYKISNTTNGPLIVNCDELTGHNNNGNILTGEDSTDLSEKWNTHVLVQKYGTVSLTKIQNSVLQDGVWQNGVWQVL